MVMMSPKSFMVGVGSYSENSCWHPCRPLCPPDSDIRRHCISGCLATSGDSYGVALCLGIILKHGVDPVCIIKHRVALCIIMIYAFMEAQSWGRDRCSPAAHPWLSCIHVSWEHLHFSLEHSAIRNNRRKWLLCLTFTTRLVALGTTPLAA